MQEATAAVLISRDERGVATVTIDRVPRHNALSAEVIDGLAQALHQLDRDRAVRVIVLTGAGATFCAGADLAEMRLAARARPEDNERDARRLARLLDLLDRLGKPTIARVNGNGFGGALGLIAACDMAIAPEEARFGLTEARLGLAPAMISPFVVRAIGERQARRYFLTAEMFSGRTAEAIGLVHRAVPLAELDDALEALLEPLLAAAPGAQREAKRLIRYVTGRGDATDRVVMDETARWIARLRASEEGIEGLTAFLEKRKPRWGD
jgi:methylglutaconyl-CoA hydratase